MRKYFVTILAAVMVISLMTSSAFAFTLTEIDTDQAFDLDTLAQENISDWAQDSVQQAVSLGLVPDHLQRSYGQAITRAEFCALAVRLYETVTNAEIEGRSTFTDTNDVNIEKAASVGIVGGVGNGRFLPDANLNREQAAQVLSALANALGCGLSQAEADFADIDTISDWARDAVGRIQAAGIMSGMENRRFAPHLEYSREQSILTMMRLYGVIHKH